MFLLLYLLTVHFIADFVLQSDWMAQNKSKGNGALLAHIVVYTICLLVAAIPLAIYLRLPEGPAVMLWVLGNGAAHLVTDYVTSRINKRLWEQKKVHWFFVGVGADQLIHTWTLGLTAMFLLGGAA